MIMPSITVAFNYRNVLIDPLNWGVVEVRLKSGDFKQVHCVGFISLSDAKKGGGVSVKIDAKKYSSGGLGAAQKSVPDGCYVQGYINPESPLKVYVVCLNGLPRIVSHSPNESSIDS